MIYFASFDYEDPDGNVVTDLRGFDNEVSRQEYIDNTKSWLANTFYGRSRVTLSLFESLTMQVVEFEKDPRDAGQSNSRFIEKVI
jgi:hypothetical protein